MGNQSYQTEQEAFWAGTFGREYIERNQGDALLAANLAFFAKALRGTSNLSTCIEFGANIGMNIKALNLLFPGLDSSAVEINEDAVRALAEVIPATKIHHQSLMDFKPARTFDLVLIKGVLIHQDASVLPQIYDTLVESTGRFLLLAEYYNPEPVELSYRGHDGFIIKRDFAGEILDRHPSMKLRDYGFAYRRDPLFAQDDITWFLLEKQ